MARARPIEIPERYSLVVTMPGPPAKSIQVEGRTAKLIAWLLQHRGRVERLAIGSLVFNMGLNTFIPEIHEHFPRQFATPESPEDISHLSPPC